MKLTEKEFKKFNNRYIITHYIISNVLVTIAILILFVVKTTNLFVAVCSLLTIVGYIVIVVINMKYQPTISIEKDSWVIRTVNYEEFSKNWLMVSSTFLAMFLLSCMTLYFVEADVWVKDKQETIIIDTISTEKDVYLLNHTDSINIIELAKIAELECASNFSDSLLNYTYKLVINKFAYCTYPHFTQTNCPSSFLYISCLLYTSEAETVWP